jgi:secreted trypsin-like serine protease
MKYQYSLFAAIRLWLAIGWFRGVLTMAQTSALAMTLTPTPTPTNRTQAVGHVRGRALIVGGVPAKLGRYPWYGIPQTKPGLCGAVLIHSDILLTAAHCKPAFRMPNSILLGGNRRDGSDAQDVVELKDVRVHPNFNKILFKKNDVMLIKLQRPSTVDVVPWNTDSNRPKTRDSLTVVGYGVTSPNKDSPESPILRQAKIKMVRTTKCQSRLSPLEKLPEYSDVEGRPYVLPDQHLCAWKRDTGSCLGDSGGPLLSGGILVGIVSTGVSCADDNFPSVFVRVSGMKSFIQQGICEMSSQPPDYCQDRD